MNEKVELEYVCLAGNHSVWAAQSLLLDSELPRHLTETNLKYRKSYVFKNADLNNDLRLILAGNDIFGSIPAYPNCVIYYLLQIVANMCLVQLETTPTTKQGRR